MNKPLRQILFALALLAAAGLARAEIVVIDDSGAAVRLAAPAKRIVSLAPHITETLFAVGAGERIVGTVDYSDSPEAAKKIPRVGGYSRLDLEAVAALKPDLVIAWESGNAKAHIDKLRALGLPVYISQPNHIDDVATALERFGQLTGQADAGRAAASHFRARLAALHGRYAARPTVRTFYQIWKQPLMTVGAPQIISDAIKLCGGENVFAALPTMAPTVTVEGVIAANPEAIVASGMGDSRPDWLDDWKRWTSITAVARNNLFFIPPDLLHRHTPRLLDGTERLCQHLETARGRRPAGK
jgi:iron complex transport system substrate-binding protein